MDHAEAVNRGVVERYMRGQLSGTDSEEFEIHFFDCQECAQELRAGAILEENAKAVFHEDQPSGAGIREHPGKIEKAEVPFWMLLWQRPWGVALTLAALGLFGVAAYQSLVLIPGLRGELKAALAPQPIATYVLPSLSRGDDHAFEVPKGNSFVALYMDPTWQGSFAEYICSFQDESGSTRLSVRIPAPPAGKPIQIHMSKNQLPPARYMVIVRNVAEAGKPESELNRYSINLKLD